MQGWWSTGQPGLPGQGWPGAALLLVSEPQRAPSAPACNTNCLSSHTHMHTHTNMHTGHTHTHTQAHMHNVTVTQGIWAACKCYARHVRLVLMAQAHCMGVSKGRATDCLDVNSLKLIWICLQHSVETSLPRGQAGDTESGTTILANLMTCTCERKIKQILLTN